MREAMAKQLDGGVAALTSMVLEQFFGETHDIMRSGVTVTFGSDGQRIRIFAQVKVMLADMPAFKDMIDCKGHSGTKCCYLCKNCVLHKAPHGAIPLHLFSEYAVSLAESDFTKFEMHDDQTLRATVAKLHSYKGVLSADAFDERAQVLGFNYNPHSIILNERFRLQVVSMTMYDWAHIYISDGLADVELGEFMQQMIRNRTDTTYSELGRYVTSFTTPRARRLPTHLFDATRYKNYLRSGSFPAIASEFLTIAPVLRRYLSNVVARRGQCMQYVSSMQAVLDVVDLLQAAKTGALQPVVLFQAITKHFELFKAAYGDNAVRPKHHYALHLPLMLQEFKTLLATLTHERKHRMAKRYTRNRANLTSFESGVVEDITMHQLWELGLPFFKAYSTSTPKGPVVHALRELFPHVADCNFTLHNSITANGGQIHAGDIVSYAFEGCTCIGKLCMTVGLSRADEKQLISIVTRWEACLVEEANSYRSYRVTDRKVKVLTDAIGTVFTYRMSTDGTQCMICVPYELR